MGCRWSRITKGYGYISSKEAKARPAKETVDWNADIKRRPGSRGWSRIRRGYGYVSSKDAKARAAREPADWYAEYYEQRDRDKVARSQNRGDAAARRHRRRRGAGTFLEYAEFVKMAWLMVIGQAAAYGLFHGLRSHFHL